MKVTEWEKRVGSESLCIGIAVSDFNKVVTDRLVEGALAYLELAGIGRVELLRVAGAWELPIAANRLFDAGCEGVVAVGAVIKGETDHYEVIVRESAAGLREASLRAGRPIGNAVLAAHDLDQAMNRSEPGPGNKGHEAAAAVVDLARKVGRS